MKKLLILVCMLFFISSVFADGSAIDGLFKDPESGKIEYNNNIAGVPKSIKSLIGNEKILFYVFGETETRHITLTMKNAIIESYSLEEDNTATIIVYAKEEAVNKILESNNRVAELKDALKRKDITYQPNSFFKKIKFGFARFALNFAK